ncbi:hypothetical protein MTO96_046596 [Rhipicephalus appendiculatus]
MKATWPRFKIIGDVCWLIALESGIGMPCPAHIGGASVKWLNEAGVVSKWHHDTVSLGADFSRCPKVQQGEAETLDFNHHRSVFLLIVAGNGLAFILVLAELFVTSRKVGCPANGAIPRRGRRALHGKRIRLITLC